MVEVACVLESCFLALSNIMARLVTSATESLLCDATGLPPPAAVRVVVAGTGADTEPLTLASAAAAAIGLGPVLRALEASKQKRSVDCDTLNQSV